MKRLWARSPKPQTYLLSRRVFLALLGVVYLAAFLSLWLQLEGLLGSRGIAPAALLLEEFESFAGNARFWRLPTLLWLARGDWVLHLLCGAGAFGSLLLVFGAAPRLALTLLWLLYLSLVSVGNVFLRYQWDTLLLETGFLAIWLAPAALRPAAAAQQPVEPLALWLLRFLLFKLMFMSGVVKLLSGDPSWRDLTAMDFHYWTQPIPSWSSWYADRLPSAVHAASVLGTFAVELVLPFLVFGPRRLRMLACAGFVGLMAMIGSTGNYGFFNLLTLALCVLLLDDSFWQRLLRRLPERWTGAPLTAEAAGRRGWPPRRAAFAVLAALLLVLNADVMLRRFDLDALRPAFVKAWTGAAAPFHVANAYGLFAVMTTQRNEIELEGSSDGKEWRPYVFRWKPGPLERRPGQSGLHMPRLDWQMWFASLRGCGNARWFHAFLRRVLQGEPAVLGLLEHDPFPERPPTYLRTRFFSYRFAEPGGDAWWAREPLGLFCPTVRLDGERLVRVRPERER